VLQLEDDPKFVLKFWQKDRRSRHPSTTSADCQTADGKKAIVE